MMAWWKWPLRFALVAAKAIAFVAALAIAFVYFEPVDYALKFLYFSALSKEHLIDQAEVYVRDRAGGNHMACLYVVECDGEHARLELVSDIVAGTFGRRRPGFRDAGCSATIALEEPRILGFTSI